jgi:hypothetical protein
VSRRHVALDPTADGWIARDLSTNGIWHEGRAVKSVRVATTATRLRLGGAEGPEVTLTPLPAPADAAPAPDDDEQTRVSPSTGDTPAPAPVPEAAATPASIAPAKPTVPGPESAAAYWVGVLPTLVWLFAAAFTVGALLALA